ncbi:MAG: monovalent cation/H(+) antiporter subunit G [Pseudomonadota bacterium]
MSAIIAAILIVIGGVLSFFAGVGVFRLPDVFIRMHAATKVGTLGSGLIIAAAAVHFGDSAIVVRCILVVFFLLLTAPIGAHMVGRAVLRMGVQTKAVDLRERSGGSQSDRSSARD